MTDYNFAPGEEEQLLAESRALLDESKTLDLNNYKDQLRSDQITARIRELSTILIERVDPSSIQKAPIEYAGANDIAARMTRIKELTATLKEKIAPSNLQQPPPKQFSPTRHLRLVRE
jgi:hypothetical protein